MTLLEYIGSVILSEILGNDYQIKINDGRIRTVINAKTGKRVMVKEHHTALCRCYVSVKEDLGIIEPYSGRFGRGFTIKMHNPQSTLYARKAYYVFKEY